MPTKLIFLGTGGGRFVTIDQLRATGGIFLFNGRDRIHIDPGPGALIKLHQYKIDPTKTNAILVSHCHPDHYIDTEILIEAMTDGCTAKKGVLLASKSILDGIPDYGPAVSKYHQSVIMEHRVAIPGEKIILDDTTIETIPALHSDKSGVGFRFITKQGVIVWGSDTMFNESLYSGYCNAKILILSVTTPLEVKIPYHLNTNDAAIIAAQCKPELCVITHFGVRMLKNNVDRQAKWIKDKSGVQTIAAKDGTTLNLDNGIGISNQRLF